MKLSELMAMDLDEREEALDSYLTGGITWQDVKHLSELIDQLALAQRRCDVVPSPAAQRVADAIEALDARAFSEWWLAGGAFRP